MAQIDGSDEAKTDAQQLKPARRWEVDALRGVAVVAMMFFHLMWDLDYFSVLDRHLASRSWLWFARGIGTAFISIVGVSLVLSDARMGHVGGWGRYLRRGGSATRHLLAFWLGELGRGFQSPSCRQRVRLVPPPQTGTVLENLLGWKKPHRSLLPLS